MDHAHSHSAGHVEPPAHHSHGREPQRNPETRPDRGHGAHAGHGAEHAGGGHDKHAGHSVEMFRDKFWGTLLLSIPTLVWAPMIQHWFGYTAPGGSPASRWIPAIFGTLVFVYGGWVFIRAPSASCAIGCPG